MRRCSLSSFSNLVHRSGGHHPRSSHTTPLGACAILTAVQALYFLDRSHTYAHRDGHCCLYIDAGLLGVSSTLCLAFNPALCGSHHCSHDRGQQ